MASSVQVKRTREIEGLSNLYFIHPISRVFVGWFARLGVTPNVVSMFGMGFGVLAAWAYFHYEQWELSVAGFGFMIMWHIMDGADGQLARLTGQTSEFGRVMDGVCDHLTIVLVYASLAFATAFEHGTWVIAVVLAAGISHLAQSSAYEFQRQMYDHWVYGKESASFVKVEDQQSEMARRTGISKVFAWIYYVYLNIQYRFSSYDEELLTRLGQTKDTGEPDFSRARDLYRSVNISTMRHWSLMSNNPRTIAIFAACIVQQPLLYFILEITLLNLLFAWLLRTQRERYSVLKARLAEMSGVESALVADPT